MNIENILKMLQTMLAVVILLEKTDRLYVVTLALKFKAKQRLFLNADRQRKGKQMVIVLSCYSVVSSQISVEGVSSYSSTVSRDI